MSGKAFGRILAAASDLPGCLSPHDARDVTVALERARVVGVLDAWTDKSGGFWSNGITKGKPCCMLHYVSGGKTPYQGMTQDAARAAAANAIEAGEV